LPFDQVGDQGVVGLSSVIVACKKDGRDSSGPREGKELTSLNEPSSILGLIAVHAKRLTMKAGLKLMIEVAGDPPCRQFEVGEIKRLSYCIPNVLSVPWSTEWGRRDASRSPKLVKTVI
jgi:hypothetical protein